MNRTMKISTVALLMAVAGAPAVFAQEDALSISNTGHVGIGTQSPGYNLTISNKLGKDAFGVDNDAAFLARNSGNGYERYLWPRRADNKMVLRYGSAGFDICNNDGSAIMHMNPGGNVGIGVTNPENKLQMGGNIHMMGNAIYLRGEFPRDCNDVVKWNGPEDRVDIAGYHGVNLGYTEGSQNSAVQTVLKADKDQVDIWGNVYTRLRPAAGPSRGKTRFGLLSYEFAGMELETRGHNTQINGNGCGGIIRFFTWGYHTAYSREVMIINEGGRVGIGTGDPQAMLEVVGTVDYITGPHNSVFGYLNASGAHGQHGGVQTRKASILASGDICTKDNFVAYSDARIKKDLKRSVNSDDLMTLNRLRVTDYRYIDNFAHGDQYKKGFIAQEVEKVYPEAVSKGQDFVPDIFAAAINVSVDNGTTTFSMAKQHHLTNGDVVRLITKQGPKELAVTVVDEKTFSVNDTADSYKEAFVFGKQVSDFRMVDYDRIFTLNVSATQQLAKEVEMLKTENELLKKRNSATEAKLEQSNVVLTSVLSRLDDLEASKKIAKQ